MQPTELVKENETLDDLILGGIKIIQPKKGYRFSLDPVLLAHFPELLHTHSVVDIGTGNGIIPLVLAYRSAALSITAVDIQAAMIDRTRRSVLYNRMTDLIQALHADARELMGILPAGKADLVTCNPPFIKRGQGKVKQDPEEAIARHELYIELADVFDAGDYLLRCGGRIALIHRADRLAELILECSRHHFQPTRLRMIHPFPGEPARLVLLEGMKGRGPTLTVMPPLIIYQSQGRYSLEIEALYHPTTKGYNEDGVEHG